MEYSATRNQMSSYIIQAQEEEIKRISLELHEGVGQNLFSILTGLKVVESGIKEDHVKNHLHEMTQLIEKTMQEIRLLSVELYPPALTALGLLPAIKSYIKVYTSTFGIVVELSSIGEEKPILEQNSIAVFRVCQEALTNIAKYADTSNVRIDLKWSNSKLKISIFDFGRGFQIEDLEKNPYSLGIATMKERMLLTGGQCEISSKIGEGTSIEISLPI
ncbi:sensor histidine kinase [Neobacillus niacini]|uniref:sensor histidine kinase n=1 Tax=Neobacillus niacini TaxID=86668 RepID=UPI0007ABB6BD|nr:sensor histidine kinase [Neobacillus niacini]MEC1522376.1 sensor histidine kinase [Neobacillus niacini]